MKLCQIGLMSFPLEWLVAFASLCFAFLRFALLCFALIYFVLLSSFLFRFVSFFRLSFFFFLILLFSLQVLWEMLTQQIPFENMSPMAVMWLVASQRKRLPIPSKCPEQFARLIESCWREKPGERPSMTEIIAILKTFRKYAELPKETQTFLGSKDIWKTEIEEVMEILKKSENEIVRREVHTPLPCELPSPDCFDNRKNLSG